MSASDRNYVEIGYRKDDDFRIKLVFNKQQGEFCGSSNNKGDRRLHEKNDRNGK